MRYIKIYEDFEWEFDEEESQPIDYDNMVGKRIIGDIKTTWWNTALGKWKVDVVTPTSFNDEIKEFKHSSECDKDSAHTGLRFAPIPNDCYVFSVENFWPWFMFKDEYIKYIK